MQARPSGLVPTQRRMDGFRYLRRYQAALPYIDLLVFSFTTPSGGDRTIDFFEESGDDQFYRNGVRQLGVGESAGVPGQKTQPVTDRTTRLLRWDHPDFCRPDE